MPLQHFPHFSDFPTQGQKTKIQPKNTKDRRKRLPMSTICHTRKCSHAHPELSYQQHAKKARQNTHRQKNTFPPPRALAISPTSAIFLPRVKRQRFNQKTQKTVARACRCLPFVTRESVPTRTLNYHTNNTPQKHDKTHTDRKTPSLHLAHSLAISPTQANFLPRVKRQDSTKKHKRPSQALADVYHLSHAKVFPRAP